jgi:hypothetical protein
MLEISSGAGPGEITHRHLDQKENTYMKEYKLLPSLAFSAAFLTAIATMPTARAEMNASGAEVVTNGPQANPGDTSGSWSTRQNVRDRQRYEALVHSDRGYRASRVKKGVWADQCPAAACLLE